MVDTAWPIERLYRERRLHRRRGVEFQRTTIRLNVPLLRRITRTPLFQSPWTNKVSLRSLELKILDANSSGLLVEAAEFLFFGVAVDRGDISGEGGYFGYPFGHQISQSFR